MGLGLVARAPPPLPTFLPAGPESHGRVMSWGLHDCSAGLALSLDVTSHPAVAWIEPPPPGSLPVHPATWACVSSPTTVLDPMGG